MNYPAPVMSITELEKQMHFSREYLKRMTHHRLADRFCQKIGKGRNSKFLFDTEEFEKLRKKGLLK